MSTTFPLMHTLFSFVLIPFVFSFEKESRCTKTLSLFTLYGFLQPTAKDCQVQDKKFIFPFNNLILTNLFTLKQKPFKAQQGN